MSWKFCESVDLLGIYKVNSILFWIFFYNNRRTQWRSLTLGISKVHLRFLLFLCSMLVERIDEDKDGYVTVEEMKKWIKHAQKRWIYDDVDRQWKSHDLNGDEAVSWEEYKNATYGYILGTAVDNFSFDHFSIINSRLLTHTHIYFSEMTCR